MTKLILPTFQGSDSFELPADGPFTVRDISVQEPTAAIGLNVRINSSSTIPCHLLLQGTDVVALAQVLLRFAQRRKIPDPGPSASQLRTGWETAITEDGSRIRLRVFDAGHQLDLILTPQDAMKLRDDVESEYKKWRGFGRH